jgi:hypothetical protein
LGGHLILIMLFPGTAAGWALIIHHYKLHKSL